MHLGIWGVVSVFVVVDESVVSPPNDINNVVPSNDPSSPSLLCIVWRHHTRLAANRSSFHINPMVRCLETTNFAIIILPQQRPLFY
jgi:hypothetical protein